MNQASYFATAPNGMTDLLAQEIASLGVEHVKETRAGVSFQGTLDVAYQVCLWSRLANRVLLPLATFPADSPDALYSGVRTIDWSAHLTAAQTLVVDANVSSSRITHSHYAALKIKDGIVDHFRDLGGPRPSVDVDNPNIRVNAYLLKDEATIYLDLSGASLHQRNYRLETGEAPLKENLAAAILLRARWPEMIEERGAFVDLMCGSGTLVIEAAMMAADIAPGLLREHWGFLEWKKHQPDIWQRLGNEARYKKDKGLQNLPTLMGFDVNRRMIERAQANATRVGLADKVRFVHQDVTSFRHDFPARGLMVTNPPYGRRLNDSGELPALYGALGNVMKKHLVGWRASVFTEEQSLGKYLGLRADKMHTLYNGAIACKLIHFDIEKDNFFRDDRLPRRVDMDDLSEQAVGFQNRLNKNLKELEKWARREAVTCFRAYDADLPDFAAAIDVYSSASNPAERWVCIQEYEAPATIDTKKAKRRTRELVTIGQDVFGVDDDHLFYKTRARQRGETQYTRAQETDSYHLVTEGAAKLWVNFEDYLDTGLFLDHRPIREVIGRESSGRDVLNLFCYTATASVHAALGGARSTTSIDMSKTYVDWAGKNFEANNLDRSKHQLVRADCVKWLAEQSGKGNKTPGYDLIFLDPPTFSNSKRMEAEFEVQRDQETLITQALNLLRPGGRLYFSTNLRNFKLATSLREKFNATDITRKTIPFDFKRRQNIHHCWQFEHLNPV